jgi:hypothetical protein
MTRESSFRFRSFPRTLKSLPFAAALAAGATLTVPAAASEPFPAYIAEKYDMPCVPACTLCHLTNLGGAANIKPDPSFAYTLLTVDAMNHMLEAGLPETMDWALAGMEAMGSDTDKDGSPDITELREGTDPNGSATPLCDVPKYGCGASVANTAPTRFGALALAASVMLVLGLRRRR